MYGVIGRLAEAKTDNCGSTQLTDEAFSYSPRGEVAYFYQSTPHSNGYYEVYQSYWPSGAPNLLNTVFAGRTMTYGVDGVGRTNSVSSSTGQNPVSAVGYTFQPQGQPFTEVGPISGISYGSGDSDSFAYDTMNRLTTSTTTLRPLPLRSATDGMQATHWHRSV